ncbi:hypothetical protein M0R72_04590 [Candidatus Pacearchaeota archaeon]|jgi:hypothetical protein|nr:hypothetical protein [Candidatus Pacearchaeota archaeon]
MLTEILSKNKIEHSDLGVITLEGKPKQYKCLREFFSDYPINLNDAPLLKKAYFALRNQVPYSNLTPTEQNEKSNWLTWLGIHSGVIKLNQGVNHYEHLQ